MFRLTRQEQMALAFVLCLLLIGWAVKTWRTSAPRPQTVVIDVGP